MIHELRKRYPVFIYQDFKTNLENKGLRISFSYKIKPNLNFSPEILIRGVKKEQIELLDKEIINNFVFNLGLIEMFSYWKATCAPLIDIKTGSLKEAQIYWWHDLLMNGMGQFFYENKINYTSKDFVKIVFKSRKRKHPQIAKIEDEKMLVPVGGGKDSATSLGLMKNTHYDIGVFVLNPPRASRNIIKVANVDKVIQVERKIDPLLLSLNRKGFLNGHTPFSAYLSFLGVFCAALFNYKNIVFSNERSSNEENVEYLGKLINHQYSKTYDFEKKFRDYNRKHLSNVNYFSFLRPIYELQIAKIFSKQNKYFNLIRSCNVGQRDNIWCCECPKCLSTFILLHPFLGPKNILKIFPKNIFNNASLESLLLDLTLDERIKPFECVGTKEELKIALYLSIKKHKQPKLPVLLKIAKKHILAKESNLAKRATKLLNDWDTNNYLPKNIEKLLKKNI